MREIEHKRTRFSKTFDLGGGRRRLEVGKLPMHFERGGKLLDIDLTPEFDGVRKHHALRNCPYALRVADDRPAYFYNSTSGRAVEVELIAPSGKPLVEGGLFKWAEVGRDTDYVIQPLPVGCATLLILHGPEAPRIWSWRIGGDIGLIQPLAGKDSGGRMLELVEHRDAKAGTIAVEWTGRMLARGDLRRKKQTVWTDNVTWPVLIDPTVNESIAANGDDARSFWVNGTAFNTFTTGDEANTGGRIGASIAYAGLRFQTIAIPNTATIDSATLTLRMTLVGGSPDVSVYGNDTDDAAAWATPGNRIKNIAKTTAFTQKTSWTSDVDDTVDVTAVVAEILARTGWASNNDIAFAIFNNAGAGTHFVQFAALEHATLTEARLSIDYTEFQDTAGSTAGSGTASGAAASVAATIASTVGTGAVTGVGAAIAASAFAISGAGAASGIGASIAAAAGFTQGSSAVAAISPELEPVPVVTYPPVGGGGFGPAPSRDDKRFRTRKDKSRPKVITVRIGDWPENPQIILGREQDAERESFYRRLVNLPAESVTKPVDEEEQALLEILAFAA